MKQKQDAVKRKLTKIAKARLGIGSLVARGRDSLDFHEVGVESVCDALADAYNLGRSDVKFEFDIVLKGKPGVTPGLDIGQVMAINKVAPGFIKSLVDAGGMA